MELKYFNNFTALTVKIVVLQGNVWACALIEIQFYVTHKIHLLRIL